MCAVSSAVEYVTSTRAAHNYVAGTILIAITKCVATRKTRSH